MYNILTVYLVNICILFVRKFGVLKCVIDTGKPTGKRSLGRLRRRWEGNIRMDFEEIGINAGNWVNSVQVRYYWRALVNAALNLRVP